METEFDNILHDLKRKGIQLSFQRMRVLEYLLQNKNHPTADKIYMDLVKEIPTLSKTTVYNTLKILEKSGPVKEIPIKDKESHYDIFIKPHGHIKCESCETVFDFDADMDSLKTEVPEGFKINDMFVYFNGICPKCLAKQK